MESGEKEEEEGGGEDLAFVGYAIPDGSHPKNHLSNHLHKH